MARPTKYKKEFAIQAGKLCKLGSTDAEMADFFEVDVATINRWKKAHKEFCASIKKGKVLADAEVANSLYQRALGYRHKDVHISQHLGKVIQTEIMKEYAPDTTAAIFWLKNRQKDKWRDKHEVEQTVTACMVRNTNLGSDWRMK